MRRNNGTKASPSSDTFDGTADMDVGKFFFVYENIIMRMKSEDVKAAVSFCYLENDAFHFYYQSFDQNVLLLENTNDFGKVKHTLVDRIAVPG